MRTKWNRPPGKSVQSPPHRKSTKLRRIHDCSLPSCSTVKPVSVQRKKKQKTWLVVGKRDSTVQIGVADKFVRHAIAALGWSISFAKWAKYWNWTMSLEVRPKRTRESSFALSFFCYFFPIRVGAQTLKQTLRFPLEYIQRHSELNTKTSVSLKKKTFYGGVHHFIDVLFTTFCICVDKSSGRIKKTPPLEKKGFSADCVVLNIWF